MKNFLKCVPYLVINFLAYMLLPLIMDDLSGAILVLFCFFPLINAILAFVYGYKSKKKDIIYVILSGILFLPAMFIYMNSSALCYMFVYLIISLIANIAGYALITKK